MTGTPSQITGQRGEQIAAEYLTRKGYTVIDLNWHCQFGEIDVVARRNDRLVFVEVRTRHHSTTETALTSITLRKRERMINSAYAYLHDHEFSPDAAWRIDIIAIALPRSGSPIIDHVENALDW